MLKNEISPHLEERTHAPHVAIAAGVTPAYVESMLLVLAGGSLLGLANVTISSVLAAFLFLFVGVVIVRAVFPFGRPELRVFLLSYACCVLVAGAIQCYEKSAFGREEGATDATSFYSSIFESPPYYSWDELNSLWIPEQRHRAGHGAPLAVATWQWVYRICMAMGLTFGIYIGVLFNSLIVGLAGSLTVATGREMFGDDGWRLRRIGTLFAACGMFWLFGAIFLRDCYTLFFNVLVLWALVRFLSKPSSTNLMLAGIIVAISCISVWYLRQKTAVLFGLFCVLAAFCWYWHGRQNVARILAPFCAILGLCSGYFYIQHYVETSSTYAQQTAEAYVGHMAKSSANDSLAMDIVVNQPLPVRAVLGSGAMLVFPIPLWGYLKPGVRDWELIKSWQGAYLVCIMPLVFAGALAALRGRFRALEGLGPHWFLAAYSIATTIAVAVTSMETRHHGQFLPAFVLLAAMPDTRQCNDYMNVLRMAFLWTAIVVGVHFAWGVMRFG